MLNGQSIHTPRTESGSQCEIGHHIAPTTGLEVKIRADIPIRLCVFDPSGAAHRYVATSWPIEKGEPV